VRGKKSAEAPTRTITLRFLADQLGLSPATISLVINRSPSADSIPQETKERVLAAARHFNYRPNFMARSLRKQRSFTIGVMVPEVSEGYAAMVMSGIEDRLLQEGYFYFVASHRHRPDLIEEYPLLLTQRSIEGLIAVDTPYSLHLAIPVVTISGHHEVEGVTNILLDHQRAAQIAVDHLTQLKHKQIAVIKGQEFSSDTEVRWGAIRDAVRKRRLELSPKLIVQLEGDSPSPDLGYVAASKLLATREPFTGLFAFNDISAIGAIRALREAGLRVPEDVSVVGFDDIPSAAYHNPALTTVRQPLRKMGETAAETLLSRISAGVFLTRSITVEPELVVRASTSTARLSECSLR